MTLRSPVVQLIPLNQLVTSPRNVRRTDRKSDIEALAASILSRGLLQNLCVAPREGDRFEVDAGGRRLAALKLLAKTGAIAKDWPVPCCVVAREEGREISLIENFHRVAMDAIDEVDAFAALVADGSTPDEIAQRFGVTRRHVDQRLALSGLSPKIKAAWKRGEVTLDAARAFCLVSDHAQQDAVFRSLGRPITHASTVRARLMDGRVRISDRLARFVGLEAYEGAGGKVLRDLFDAEAVFIEDPGLLTKLAEEKLALSAAAWFAEGWSWIEVNLGTGRVEGLSSTRLHPEWRDPTSEEQAELDRISAEIEALDAELEADSTEDDARWTRRDDLEAAYEAIRQAGRFWSPEMKQMSGVVLSLDHAGEPVSTEGAVRIDDQKRVEAFLAQRRREATGADDGESDTTGRGEVRTSALPKAVNRDLTLVRTRAIRLMLSGDPDVALALCVSSLLHRALHCAELPGVSISAQTRQVDDHAALDEVRSELEGRLPTDGLALVNMSRERLLAVLAVMVASAIDLTHEDTSQADLSKQGLADQLALHLDIDMKQFWAPDLTFWARLPKATLMAALAEAPAMAAKGQRTHDDAIKAHAKLRKDELAGKIAVLFEGAGYLPDILVTPVAAGNIVVTPEGVAAIQVPAVAAE